LGGFLHPAWRRWCFRSSKPLSPRACEIETIWGPQCFTRRLGEVLHPDREPLETLARIRRTVGEYNFAGQYQQVPRVRAFANFVASEIKSFRALIAQSTASDAERTQTVLR